MKTKTYAEISAQEDRIIKYYEKKYGFCKRIGFAMYISRIYRERIINHFGGYKKEDEFHTIFITPVPQNIYSY